MVGLQRCTGGVGQVEQEYRCCFSGGDWFIKLFIKLQVQQELSSTFARLCHLVDESTAEMKDSGKQMERQILQLEEMAGRAKVLRNQATFLANKLEMFHSTYLQTE